MRWKLLGVIAVVVVTLGLVLALRGSKQPMAEDSSGTTHVSAGTSMPPTTTDAVPAPPPPSPGFPAVPPVVDLAALRKKLPDNLYWSLAAPTTDTAEQDRRGAESRAYNELFGKVQSNTATEPEIARYYAHKREVSRDYAQFARTVLADYGDQLTATERNLYELGAKMNEQRLAQLPGEESRAVDRRRAHEAKKR